MKCLLDPKVCHEFRDEVNEQNHLMQSLEDPNKILMYIYHAMDIEVIL